MNLRRLFRRNADNAELTREINAHIAHEIDENMAHGMSPEEARRQAHLKFGSSRRVLEDAWQRSGIGILDDLSRDLRYAARTLSRSPGFTLTVVLSLALGIGAATAIFSIVYAVLLHPYPFRDWERIVRLMVVDKKGNERGVAVTGQQLLQLREAKCIEEIVGTDQWNLTTTGSGLPEDVSAYYMTPNATSYFGVPAFLGRGLEPSDAPEGQEPQPVVELGYRFWQRYYGSDRTVLGRTLQLSHNNYTIVGVMSPLMNWGGGDVYLPLKITSDSAHRLGLTLRLRRGVSIDAANAELQPLLEAFAKERPDSFVQGFRAHITPLYHYIASALGPSLYLLFGAVCLLLLIGCLNVSILLMARGTQRQHELAVRSAVGAARRRIVRQLLTESLALALGGEILGIALAYASQRLIIQQLPGYLLQRQASIHINLPVLFFSIAVTLLTVVLFGLLPALQSSRTESSPSMQLTVQKMTGGRGGRRIRSVLIAGQIALTLVLLAAGATSIRAFLRLMHADLGYDPHNAMAILIPVHQNSYSTWEQRSEYFDRLQQKISSTAEVTVAAVSNYAVPPNNGWTTVFDIYGQTALGDQQVRTNLVSPEYFAALHIPILQGRLWERAESLRAARVAILNGTMARQYWPNGDAVGKRIRFPAIPNNPPYQLAAPGSSDWFEIIGVAGDSLNDGLRSPVKPAAYLPYTINMPMSEMIVVRTKPDPLSLLHTLRAQVQAVDSEQQVANNATSLEAWITSEDDWQREHLVAVLFGAFSLLTLALAGVGIFSVVSYTVAQRTNEFAIRIALGAQRGDVLWSVLLSMFRVIAAGAMAGVVLDLSVDRIVSRWADASARDPLVVLLVVPLLAAVAALACYVPARRATSLDPMDALRNQ